ncbi:hypothetical protein BE17_37145 [Sorangium cellulosum]|uniref:Uncharacterized protein n=1 Tax=Sorangium cellulosum TaxID=56 RepID=A0A150SM83_SORCE|nr:hypothetical protein BE17_37145 [Sorangium cellulosum]
MSLPVTVDGDGAELTDARLELARAAPPGVVDFERRGWICSRPRPVCPWPADAYAPFTPRVLLEDDQLARF